MKKENYTIDEYDVIRVSLEKWLAQLEKMKTSYYNYEKKIIEGILNHKE